MIFIFFFAGGLKVSDHLCFLYTAPYKRRPLAGVRLLTAGSTGIALQPDRTDPHKELSPCRQKNDSNQRVPAVPLIIHGEGCATMILRLSLFEMEI